MFRLSIHALVAVLVSSARTRTHEMRSAAKVNFRDVIATLVNFATQEESSADQVTNEERSAALVTHEDSSAALETSIVSHEEVSAAKAVVEHFKHAAEQQSTLNWYETRISVKLCNRGRCMATSASDQVTMVTEHEAPRWTIEYTCVWSCTWKIQMGNLYLLSVNGAPTLSSSPPADTGPFQWRLHMLAQDVRAGRSFEITNYYDSHQNLCSSEVPNHWLTHEHDHSLDAADSMTVLLRDWCQIFPSANYPHSSVNRLNMMRERPRAMSVPTTQSYRDREELREMEEITKCNQQQLMRMMDTMYEETLESWNHRVWRLS